MGDQLFAVAWDHDNFRVAEGHYRPIPNPTTAFTASNPAYHHHIHINMSTAATSAAASAAAHKPILAERFKTKVCQNFETTGVCPYEARCMFAHGDHELRTKQMNLNDNLVTEEAIKAFQKARAIAAKSAQKKRERDEEKKLKSTSPKAAAAMLAVAPSEEETAAAEVAVSADDSSSEGATPRHHAAVKQTFVLEYDASKYVSPLAAAMMCRPVLVAETCHCAACRDGEAHTDGAAAILLA